MTRRKLKAWQRALREDILQKEEGVFSEDEDEGDRLKVPAGSLDLEDAVLRQHGLPVPRPRRSGRRRG